MLLWRSISAPQIFKSWQHVPIHVISWEFICVNGQEGMWYHHFKLKINDALMVISADYKHICFSVLHFQLYNSMITSFNFLCFELFIHILYRNDTVSLWVLIRLWLTSNGAPVWGTYYIQNCKCRTCFVVLVECSSCFPQENMLECS